MLLRVLCGPKHSVICDVRSLAVTSLCLLVFVFIGVFLTNNEEVAIFVEGQLSA